MGFMKESARDGKPFFAYIPTNTPHGPLIAKDEDIKAIEEAFAASPLWEIDSGLKEELIQYMGMIRNIDTNMGRLQEFLEKNKH